MEGGARVGSRLWIRAPEHGERLSRSVRRHIRVDQRGLFRPRGAVEIPHAGLLVPERPDVLRTARDVGADLELAIREFAVVRRDAAVYDAIRGVGRVGRVRRIGGIAAIGSIGRIRRIGSIVGTISCDSISGAVVVINPICLRAGGGIVDGCSPNVANLTTITGFVAAGERHGQSDHDGTSHKENLHCTCPTERETRMACRTP